ncbi:MAG: FecR domain-containing protein [Tannerella sp.]|nr:FecR domain-containing protein [Tannerella sp.]
MDKNKEDIYDRINSKIDADETVIRMRGNRKRLRFGYSAAACIAVLCMIATYQVGLRSQGGEPQQTEVELRVPYGILSEMTLPDGTRVVLNGGSRLTYSTPFGAERQVYLSGGGFFDVAKDEKHPFTVHSKNVSARVLGTRFAFNAYESDLYTVLTLEEGCVEALLSNEDMKKESILLTPAQQLVLDNHTGEFQRKNVNTAEYTSWKDGILHFRGETLHEIAVILERRFDVKIHVLTKEIGNDGYVAQFKYGENVEQILDKLSYKRSWKYAKREDGIEISER